MFFVCLILCHYSLFKSCLPIGIHFFLYCLSRENPYHTNTFRTFCPQAFCQREHILVHCGKTLYLYRYECQISTLASMIGQGQGAPVDVECRPVDLLPSPRKSRESTDSVVNLHVVFYVVVIWWRSLWRACLYINNVNSTKYQQLKLKFTELTNTRTGRCFFFFQHEVIF